MSRSRKSRDREAKKIKQAIQRRRISKLAQAGPPKSFSIAPGRDTLQLVGPLVVASWSVSKNLADQLVAEGKTIPPPVTGMVLVDTGASTTSISIHAAESLGLKPIRTVSNYGAHGAQSSPVYRAAFTLAINNQLSGKRTIIRMEYDFVIGVPQLQEMFAALAKDDRGRPVNVVGIIGRDFLRHVVMRYNGPSGTLEMDIDLDSMSPSGPMMMPSPIGSPVPSAVD